MLTNGNTAMLFSVAAGTDLTRLRDNIAMPTTIAASARNAVVIAAQRRRARRFCTVLEFARQLRVAYLIVIEVHDRDAHAMLQFARTKIMQERSPPLVFFEVFSGVFGEKNVPGVAAIHHSVSHVKTGAGEIGSFVYIHNPANGPAGIPIRSCSRGCSLSARLISTAHCAGASGLV